MIIQVRMIKYRVTKLEEQEPKTRLLIPDPVTYLRSAVAGSSSSSSEVSTCRSYHYNIHTSSSQTQHNRTKLEREDNLTFLVFKSFLNGTKISSNFDFTSSTYVATIFLSSSSTGICSPAVKTPIQLL